MAFDDFLTCSCVISKPPKASYFPISVFSGILFRESFFKKILFDVYFLNFFIVFMYLLYVCACVGVCLCVCIHGGQRQPTGFFFSTLWGPGI